MQFSSTEITIAIVLSTFVFALAPLFLILYVKEFNRRKRLNREERLLMKERFEAELLRTHVEVQEQTMQRIAHELHDNIGQLLSLTTLTLSSIQIKDPVRSAEKISNSISLVNKSIKELRDLAKLLHGEPILRAGLADTIQHEVNQLEKAGIYQIRTMNKLTKGKMPPSDKDLIFLRLLQEIFNNIIKHSQATFIEIEVAYHAPLLHLMVRDNGVGFDYEVARLQSSGMGFQSIHQRVHLVKGFLQVSSSPGQGSQISIQIPYP